MKHGSQRLIRGTTQDLARINEIGCSLFPKSGQLLRLASLAPRRATARVTPASTHAEIAARGSTHREAVTSELAGPVTARPRRAGEERARGRRPRRDGSRCYRE